jgi:hypothetical protein
MTLSSFRAPAEKEWRGVHPMKCLALLSFIGFFCAGNSLANATLGEDASTSVPSDHVHMYAQNTQSLDHKNLKVHLFKSHSVMIKEFVGQDGSVFAVSWRGLTNPDLQTLLGHFYSDYHAADAQVPKGRRHVRQAIETSDIVVLHAGHFPHLRGHAYIKSKLPAGWHMEDLL